MLKKIWTFLKNIGGSKYNVIYDMFLAIALNVQVFKNIKRINFLFHIK